MEVFYFYKYQIFCKAHEVIPANAVFEGFRILEMLFITLKHSDNEYSA
jgi:hypothetical protein